MDERRKGCTLTWETCVCVCLCAMWCGVTWRDAHHIMFRTNHEPPYDSIIRAPNSNTRSQPYATSKIETGRGDKGKRPCPTHRRRASWKPTRLMTHRACFKSECDAYVFPTFRRTRVAFATTRAVDASRANAIARKSLESFRTLGKWETTFNGTQPSENMRGRTSKKGRKHFRRAMGRCCESSRVRNTHLCRMGASYGRPSNAQPLYLANPSYHPEENRIQLE